MASITFTSDGGIKTTGDIHISHNTTDNMLYNTTNPMLKFSENGTQSVGIVYTDWDAYRPSKGIKVMDVDNDDIGNVWFEAQGSIYAPSFNATSARKDKENIKDATLNATELINSVNVVEFNFKNDTEKNKKIGFIADDTSEVLATKNHDTMDVYSCIGVLIKAIQELSSEVEILKKEKING